MAMIVHDQSCVFTFVTFIDRNMWESRSFRPSSGFPEGGLHVYYPPEVRRGKYWGMGVFLLQYFPLVSIWKCCIMNALP